MVDCRIDDGESAARTCFAIKFLPLLIVVKSGFSNPNKLQIGQDD